MLGLLCGPGFVWAGPGGNIRPLLQARESAENFLSRRGRSHYDWMMRGFSTFFSDCFLPLLQGNHYMSIQVTELRQGVETVMVGDAIGRDEAWDR